MKNNNITIKKDANNEKSIKLLDCYFKIQRNTQKVFMDILNNNIREYELKDVAFHDLDYDKYPIDILNELSISNLILYYRNGKKYFPIFREYLEELGINYGLSIIVNRNLSGYERLEDNFDNYKINVMYTPKIVAKMIKKLTR